MWCYLNVILVGEEEYNYSGSEDETEEPPEEGEPSSIALQPGESTLRRNFLKLQQEKENKTNKERYKPPQYTTILKTFHSIFTFFFL